MGKEKTGMKKYYGLTFLIGLGFFTMGLMDPLYDTYIPIFLSKFIDSKGLIGSIMTLDNIFAIFLIPVAAALSDRTRTKIGRRIPFIIVLLPITAIIFGIIPFTALQSLTLLIIGIFFLNLFKQTARGPVVALMPDTIPGEYRSEANGVINTMGGIAAIVGTIGLAKLMDVYITIPGMGSVKNILPFPIAGILVILATVLLFLFVKERTPDDSEKEEKVPIIKSIKLVFTQTDKSAFFILISLFLWFIGYQGVLPYIGLYSVETLKVSQGTAALAAGMVAIAYAGFAIPSGIIAHKVGRKKLIRISLLGLTVVTFLLFLHHPLMTAFGLNGSPELFSFWALMFVFGAFWGSVITNSFPMLWQMASYGNMGIYTGLYYTFSQAAAIVAPPISGLIIDLSGYRGMFLFCSISMVAAFFTMGFVKKGEPVKTES